jgi:hypothetical protein
MELPVSYVVIVRAGMEPGRKMGLLFAERILLGIMLPVGCAHG